VFLCGVGHGTQRVDASSVRTRNHPTEKSEVTDAFDSRFTKLKIRMQGSVCSSVEACAGFHGMCSVGLKVR
jgi:hypothetical protein